MSRLKNFLKFTEMLSDAERELGISHLAELDKQVIYYIQKGSFAGKTISFEELNQLMETPRAILYRHVQSLVDQGLLIKQQDPNDGRRYIITVSL